MKQNLFYLISLNVDLEGILIKICSDIQHAGKQTGVDMPSHHKFML